MNQYELKEILRLHKLWLEDNIEGKKANLSYANLSYANLSYANLSSADLRYANLSSADLRYADLRYANLSSANLSYANLRYADLSYANLISANLLTFMFERDTAYYCGGEKIRIGCEFNDISYWIKNYEIIGKKSNYTDKQLHAYKYFIDYCAKLYKENKPHLDMHDDFEKEL